jgi:tetratricopeptide (TPR) repeat protein
VKYSLFYFLWLVLCPAVFLNAQEIKTTDDVSSSVIKSWQKAREALRSRDHKEAEKLLCRVLNREPNFIEARRDLGILYFQQGKYADALPQLQFASIYPGSRTVGQQIMLVQTYWELDSIHAVIKLADLTLSQFDLSDKNRLQVEKIKRDALFIAQLTDTVNPNVQLTRLSDAINTEWPEYLPAVTADGRTLIFTRRIRNQEVFFQSQLDSNDMWTPAISLRSLNSEFNQGALCVSADDKH